MLTTFISLWIWVLMGFSTIHRTALYFRFIFVYIGAMWHLPESRICDFTVRCKGCGENIPAPVMTMPDSWIVAESRYPIVSSQLTLVGAIHS